LSGAWHILGDIRAIALVKHRKKKSRPFMQAAIARVLLVNRANYEIVITYIEQGRIYLGFSFWFLNGSQTTFLVTQNHM
jgi:hypothetical protein